MKSQLLRFVRDTSGATAIEYGLIAAGISVAIIAIGVAAGLYVEHWISIRPSTDDATIDADVVHVASAVGGTLCLIAWLSSRPRLIWGSP